MTTKKNHRLILGAHMSIAGSMSYAFDRAESIGCTTMQIFTKSNRQWYAKPTSDADAQLFIEREHHSLVRPVVAHASYLINLGAENPEIEKKSIDALTIELQRCHQLNIPYLVLHPGSAGSQSPEDCLKKIAANLTKILSKDPNTTMICLENMAGHGASVGHAFEQLAFIGNNVTPKNRIGYCFDTCHGFAAGYDMRTQDAYEKTWQKFDSIIGLSGLKVIHLNDSKKELGCRVDRHEDIGKGKLGLEAFKLLMNDERFFGVAKILETPEESIEDYARNLATLKGLLSDSTKKIFGVE